MKYLKAYVVEIIAVVAVVAIAIGLSGVLPQPTDIRDSVVALKNGEKTYCGGTVVSSDGAILTARHCITGAGEDGVAITLRDGTATTAEVLWASGEERDLALMKISEPIANLKPAAVRCNPVSLSETLTVVGHPMGEEWTTVKGGVTNDKRVDDHYLQFQGPIGPGNSGGALFDQDGKLVGVTSKMLVVPTGFGLFGPAGVAPLGIGFAVSNETICQLLMKK